MAAQAAADYVSPSDRNISPPPNPTPIAPVESDGVHHIAKPHSQPIPVAHGTGHPRLK